MLCSEHRYFRHKNGNDLTQIKSEIEIMKKHNRNIFAYVRNPHPHSNDETTLSKVQEAAESHTIYNDIIEQMDPDQTEYIQKLLTKVEKQDAKAKKNNKNPLFHERIKSFAGSFVRSHTNSIHEVDTNVQIDEKNRVSRSKQVFSGKQNIEKQNKIVKKSIFSPKTKTEIKEENIFLSSLNAYIGSLSQSSGKEKSKMMNERQTVQKYKEQRLKQEKLLFEIDWKEKNKKINQIERNLQQKEHQNFVLKSKLKKMKAKAVKSIDELTNENDYLLNEVRFYRSKVEDFERIFSQIHQKFLIHGNPNQKNHRNSHQNRDFSKILSTIQITEEDEETFDNLFPKSRKNSQAKLIRHNQQRRVRSNLADFGKKIPQEIHKSLLRNKCLVTDSDDSESF